MGAELGGKGGFTGALEAGHQNGLQSGPRCNFDRLPAHEGGHFVANDLDHRLTRLNGLDDVLAHRLVLDAVRKFFGNLEVDVGIHQSTTDFLDSFCNIDVRNASTAT